MKFPTTGPVDIEKLTADIADASGWVGVTHHDVDPGITLDPVTGEIDVPDVNVFDPEIVARVIREHEPSV